MNVGDPSNILETIASKAIAGIKQETKTTFGRANITAVIFQGLIALEFIKGPFTKELLTLILKRDVSEWYSTLALVPVVLAFVLAVVSLVLYPKPPPKP